MHRSNVFDASAENIASILELHFPTGTILDVNYGHGVFYKHTNGRKVTGVDIRPTGNVIADNKSLPFADNSFDVGVLDPPYKRGRPGDHARGRGYVARYGKAPMTETQVTWSYEEALPELLRVCRNGIIIKIQDGTDGHKFIPRHVMISEWMRSATGLYPHDISVNARHSLPSTMVQGKPRFFQQGISYFLIYKWLSKAPYRVVRF